MHVKPFVQTLTWSYCMFPWSAAGIVAHMLHITVQLQAEVLYLMWDSGVHSTWSDTGQGSWQGGRLVVLWGGAVWAVNGLPPFLGWNHIWHLQENYCKEAEVACRLAPRCQGNIPFGNSHAINSTIISMVLGCFNCSFTHPSIHSITHVLL